MNKNQANNYKMIWNKLDKKKLNIFSYDYGTFIIDEQEEFINKLEYRMIFSELLKTRNSKACMNFKFHKFLII